MASFPPIRTFLAAAERGVAAAMEAAYKLWLAAVRAAVMMPFTRWKLSPDPAGIWVATHIWDSRVERLIQDLQEVARHGWDFATIDLNINLPYDRSSSLLADQLQRTRNLMVRTPGEVYRMVVAELAKGGTVQEQADRVDALLTWTGTENWPARARTVAVTEVTRAFNFGGLAAAFKAQEHLGQISKVWDAKRDDATRTEHRRAHGQKVPVSQPFQVGGEALMAPGDPSGSPSNVINCRCHAEFRRSP